MVQIANFLIKLSFSIIFQSNFPVMQNHFPAITWCTRALKHSSADDWNCRLHPCSLCGRESVGVISTIQSSNTKSNCMHVMTLH